MMGPFQGFDNIPSRYQFAVVVSLRARALQGGARPLMLSSSRNCSRIAQQEAMAGRLDFFVLPPETDVPLPSGGEPPLTAS